MQGMPTGDRLSALDAAFLHLEKGGAHMHVAAVMVFDGEPPSHEELMAGVESKLHLVPRYRQRLAFVPGDQGRPVWVDDPHFNLGYHVRHTALPSPGSDQELRRLAGRLLEQPLDRGKPLWEMWLVEGLAPTHHGARPRWALIGKTHHALVDGVSGVDITAVLLDVSPEPAPVEPPRPWAPSPPPGGAQLLVEALVERATQPREALRGVRALLRAPRQAAGAVAGSAAAVGAMAWAGVRSAPPSRLNVPIGPHRRYTWVDADLALLKEAKTALGGTVNDAVLTVVALALGRHLRRHGDDTTDLVLRAMVPVSVRADTEHGALGNRVSAMYAPLPVGVEDPAECFVAIREAMGDLKASGQAASAEVITRLGDFAPPTILSQAARLQARQRLFNLVVTNVPGPQFPLYLAGRRLLGLYPVVPLAQRQALGVAIMSYDGRVGFGLLSDLDALPDLDALATDLDDAVHALARAARGEKPARPRRARRPAPVAG